MSINGVLEDLALADVLQFVHISRRTGTLYLWREDDRRAEIGFHDGHIVSAWSPGHRRLGDLLTASGIIDEVTVERALQRQKDEEGRRILGQILLADGVVTRDDIHRVVKEQVQATIFDLLTWRYGSFHFEIDELHPIDGIGLVPGEVLDDLDLNTQMLLLDAARLFDDQHRKAELPAAADTDLDPLDRRLKLAGLGRTSTADGGTERDRPPPGRKAPEPVRCQIVSQDRGLLTMLRQELPSELARVVPVRPREAGNRVPGEGTSPIVLFDLRADDVEPTDIASLARTRPGAGVVAVTGSRDEARRAYEAGAVAVFEAGDEAVIDCCRNLARAAGHAQPPGPFGIDGGGFSRFRRVVFDVRSGLHSATMALNLMNVISESVERAVLFLVQGEDLTAVGAFGFSSSGEGLAGLTSGLRLRPEPRSVLRRALDIAKPQSLDFDDAHLGPELEPLLGRPASGQVVIFPVQGAERNIALIYTDNGTLDEEIQDIKILELATSQVGVAFEDELLRQKLGEEGLDAVFGSA
ncbi:MAG: DUF4388 domain-containing protein [bacterium]|nr:DUF4388 domain-containing protein [bacterium]